MALLHGRRGLDGPEGGHIRGPGSTAGELSRDEADARRYVRLTLAYALGLYAALALALAGMLPAWALPPIVPLVYLRLALALHELMHVCRPSGVPFFHRLTMVLETPLCLGYREHRATHLLHHRFAATNLDPEIYQIRGGAIRAFVNAMLSPERTCIAWVRRHGVSGPLALEGSVRLIVFGTVLAWDPWVFLVYWASLRVGIGVTSFVFHHVLHSRNGRLGTFALPLAPRLSRVAEAILGSEPMLILTEHERHHRWPNVRARDLPRLPDPRGAPEALPRGGQRAVAEAMRAALPAERA